MDYLLTFGALAGAALPGKQALDGVSISPLMEGDEIEQRAIFWHYPLYLDGPETVKPVFGTDRMYWRGTPCSVMRQGGWKLMQFFETGTVELDHVKGDVGEKSDLAAIHPERAAEMLEGLKRWQKETGAEVPSTLNPGFAPDSGPKWKGEK